ncbi:MAG TPA: energy transducer TonB [Steroidobacteraceae bacterium]|nr:energy transducer TonB [Steroidobacteraceae bacterium]
MANPASSAPRNLESVNAGSSVETPSAAARPSVDLTALTDRDDFLLELGEALGGQASVSPVDSIDTAIAQLASSKRGQMLVIDARGTSDVRADVQRAVQQAPNAVVIVFAEGDSEKQVASAVKGSSVFAVLTIPIEGPKTAAVLDAAIADAVSRSAAARSPERPADAGGSAGALTLGAFRPAMSSSAAAEAQGPEDGGRNWAVWAGLGLAVVALASGGAWYFTHGKKVSGAGPAAEAAGTTLGSQAGTAPESAAVLPQPAVDTSIVNGQVDDLLEKARRAMRDRRYTAPTGDNALVYYRSALAADSTSGEAKDGLRRVADVLVSRFNDAMAGAHFGDAALALATLKLARPADSHLDSFQIQLSTAEISKALNDGNADRAAALLRQAQQSGAVPAAQLAAWRAQLAHLQQSDKVQSLASLVLDRIRADELTSPAGDSAQTYLGQLRAAAPSSPATARAASALVSAFFAKARQNALSGDTADEGHWLAAARANGASAADVADFQRQVAGAQAKAAHLRTDRLVSLIGERLSSGALTSPAGDSAADYLQQLEDARPAGSAQAAAAQDRSALAAKLIARARGETRSGDTDAANADLAAATNWGASAAAVAAVQRLGASSQSPSRPAAGPDLAALAKQLQRTRYVAPEYPDRALNERISGSVTVQYVVNKKGYTTDVQVTDSTPPGVFDRAATDAIRHWRYRPAKYNGAPVEVPVRTRIRFELPN